MKQSRTIVHESQKKKMGRPRSVSDDDLAPAVAVRLRRSILAKVEAWAANSGVSRSDVIRDMVEQALAAAPKRVKKPKAD
jgi:Ribbon-helix-helix protein, copG family